MVEIIGKKINERPSWKSKYWYIIVSTDSGTKKLKVNGYEFGKYKIGKTYPIKKTQGFFGWHVLNPKS